MTWWRDAVIYQVYVRSFADTDGDGVGDLPGIVSRLPYIQRLGVDAIWLNPFYPSPQADGGYDVADYRDVDPRFGTLADFDRLVAEAHALGLRVIVDIVPNHTSSAHAWFQAALAAEPGSPARARYLFREGRGRRRRAAEQLASAVRRTGVDPGDRAGRRARPVVPAPVRHLAAGPRLVEPRGAATSSSRPCASGSTAASTGSASTSPTGSPRTPSCPTSTTASCIAVRPRRATPTGTSDEVHEVYRRWRRVADEYDGDRAFVAEAWLHDPERLAALPATRRAAHRVQLPLPARAAGTPTSVREAVDSTARRGLRRRCSRDVGAVEPRRHPPRHPLRRRRGWASDERGRPRCSCSRCPGAPTSTRGRSWGCPRSTTCPTSCARTRRSCGLAARSRTRRMPRPDALVGRRAAIRLHDRAGSVAAAAIGVGEVDRRTRGRTTGLHALALPRGARAATHARGRPAARRVGRGRPRCARSFAARRTSSAP